MLAEQEAHQATLEHLRTARSRRDEIVNDYESLEKADRFIEQLEEDAQRAKVALDKAFFAQNGIEWI